MLFQSPVVDLTSFLLTLLSLHPGMLEGGLDESACVVPLDTPPLSLSPDCNQDEEGSLDPVEVIFCYDYFGLSITTTVKTLLRDNVLCVPIYLRMKKLSQKSRINNLLLYLALLLPLEILWVK